jgi:hypothetical protein
LEKERTNNSLTQWKTTIYHRLRHLFPDLPTKYIDSAIYKAKQYPTDKSVVFGGKRLFEKLCKNHPGKNKGREHL